MVVAGYETTATALAWAVERLRRHPRLLSRLTDEVDAGRIGIAAGHHLGSAAYEAGCRRLAAPHQEANPVGGSRPLD